MRSRPRFADELRAVQAGRWVIVDEVQRLPNLLNEVHRFIEERRMRFVLCGSSARKFKRSGVNLLAGRALHRFMHPFLPEEVGAPLDVEEWLQYGLLPLVWGSIDKQERLSTYAQLYLREEIKAEALVRNLTGFSALFTFGCAVSRANPQCNQYGTGIGCLKDDCIGLSGYS